MNNTLKLQAAFLRGIDFKNNRSSKMRAGSKMILSPQAQKHVQSPRNMGMLAGATHFGVSGTKGEGPYCYIWLRIKDGSITDASFECNGCPSMIAASSQITELIVGRTVSQAGLIEPRDLLLILGGLPEGKEVCADRATRALHTALKSPITEEQP